jgi:hypothetical protein
VLLCQATAWVHAAATPHVTCVEHGESVHLAPGVADHHGDGLAVSAPRPESTAHAHEHCNLQGQRSTSATAPVRTSASASLVDASVPAAADVTPALRLLLLAPKTSPPRAPVV